jgi:putative flippase GtrA
MPSKQAVPQPILATTNRKLVPLLKLLFVAPTDHGAVQFLRYGFTAVVAFIVDFGLLYVFTSGLHLFYLLSATSSFAISVFANYLLSTAWVFAKRSRQQRAREITLFIIICVVALGLNDIFMWLFTSAVGIYYLHSKLLTVAIVFFWSFGARKFLFRSPKLELAAQEE